MNKGKQRESTIFLLRYLYSLFVIESDNKTENLVGLAGQTLIDLEQRIEIPKKENRTLPLFSFIHSKYAFCKDLIPV